MKYRTIVYLLAMFALLSSVAFATMNGPTGLAVDSKGNLYVANFNSNQIQMYGPTHTLIKTKTITSGISGPLSIALDLRGNLWVANFSGNNVTEYTGGKQVTVLTNGVSNPTSIAVDPMGDVWLVNGAASVTVLDSVYLPILNVPASKILPGASVVYNVAFSSSGLCAFGTNTAHSESLGADFLALGNAASRGAQSGDGGRAMAFGGTDVYFVDGDGTVERNFEGFTALPYVASGMAVDTARSLLYFSDNATNQVDVYTTTGKYVTTIQ